MSASTSVLGLLTVLLSFEATLAHAQHDAWQGLEHRTAWILLADIDAVTGQWATLPKHEIARRHNRARVDIVPEVGDTLRLTAPSTLVIIEFEQHRELNRLATPACRAMSVTDVVGRLPAGSMLIVQEVSRGEVIQGIQGIWARVSPKGN